MGKKSKTGRPLNGDGKVRKHGSNGENGEKSSTKSSTSARAGLYLPVARTHTFLKKNSTTKRVSGVGSVFATAGIELILKKMIKATVDTAEETGAKRIGVPSLIAAARNDPTLRLIFAGYAFASSQTLPRPGDLILSKAAKALKKQRNAAAKKLREEAKAEKASKVAAEKTAVEAE